MCVCMYKDRGFFISDLSKRHPQTKQIESFVDLKKVSTFQFCALVAAHSQNPASFTVGHDEHDSRSGASSRADGPMLSVQTCDTPNGTPLYGTPLGSPQIARKRISTMPDSSLDRKASGGFLAWLTGSNPPVQPESEFFHQVWEIDVFYSFRLLMIVFIFILCIFIRLLFIDFWIHFHSCIPSIFIPIWRWEIIRGFCRFRNGFLERAFLCAEQTPSMYI